ncbi:hypothetical protein WMF04_34475 [Sorangium sp. So ce260]|uniref:hypothetical protein n=1 Tax=Sorangium sp. So ce260 TaxID=3133291 RepID=UPI003F5E89EF
MAELAGFPARARPRKGEHHLTPTRGAIAAPLALFVGVQHIRRFGYRHVRMFVRHALGALALGSPETRHGATALAQQR